MRDFYEVTSRYYQLSHATKSAFCMIICLLFIRTWLS
jgi:hypothetical protein